MPKATKATAVVAITVADESGLTCIYPKCVAAGHCLGHFRSSGMTILEQDLSYRR